MTRAAPLSGPQLRELVRIYQREMARTGSVEEALRSVFSQRLAGVQNRETRMILDRVAFRFGITREQILRHSQFREVVRPRKVAMLVMRLAGLEYWRIAAAFGRRHATTAMHAVEAARKDSKLLEMAEQVAMELELIERPAASLARRAS